MLLDNSKCMNVCSCTFSILTVRTYTNEALYNLASVYPVWLVVFRVSIPEHDAHIIYANSE